MIYDYVVCSSLEPGEHLVVIASLGLKRIMFNGCQKKTWISLLVNIVYELVEWKRFPRSATSKLKQLCCPYICKFCCNSSKNLLDKCLYICWSSYVKSNCLSFQIYQMLRCKLGWHCSWDRDSNSSLLSCSDFYKFHLSLNHHFWIQLFFLYHSDTTYSVLFLFAACLIHYKKNRCHGRANLG